MSRAAEDRIAQLLAQGHVHRLATQLAIHEAREQLAPLRSVAGFVGGVARLVSGGGTGSGVAAALTRFGVGHPWTVSTLAMAALRLLRRRPLPALAAASAAAAAWWLLQRSGRAPAAAHAGDGEDAAQASG